MEHHYVYQPYVRACPIPRSSWPMQNRFCVYVCVCIYIYTCICFLYWYAFFVFLSFLLICFDYWFFLFLRERENSMNLWEGLREGLGGVGGEERIWPKYIICKKNSIKCIKKFKAPRQFLLYDYESCILNF